MQLSSKSTSDCEGAETHCHPEFISGYFSPYCSEIKSRTDIELCDNKEPRYGHTWIIIGQPTSQEARNAP
jgi:hypothetical protein